MNLPISKRLLACCQFVRPGDRVADVGCDHGYLGIHLLLQNIASSVIASDARPMPLQSAVENGEKYGVRQRMTFVCCDGVTALPRDFDVLVCAGMGADTIISILDAAPWLRGGSYRLILQCQSKQPMLRQYLSEQGWEIRDEAILRDGRFLYTVMNVLPCPVPPLSPGECFIPPCMRQAQDALLPEYFEQVTRLLRTRVNGQGQQTQPELRQALAELEAFAQTPIPCKGESL